jgi:Avirulence protein
MHTALTSARGANVRQRASALEPVVPSVPVQGAVQTAEEAAARGNLAQTPPRALPGQGLCAWARQRAASLSSLGCSPSRLLTGPSTPPGSARSRTSTHSQLQRPEGMRSAPSTPVRHLIRHPKSLAPPEERQLFGVARWPEVFSPRDVEESPQNKKYGWDFSREALRIGQHISQQKNIETKGMMYFWRECQKWRAAKEKELSKELIKELSNKLTNQLENKNSKHKNKELTSGIGSSNIIELSEQIRSIKKEIADFSKERFTEHVERNTFIVSGYHYAYLAPRILALPGTRQYLRCEKIDSRELEMKRGLEKAYEPVLAVSHTATTTLLRGRKVRLTQLEAWLEPDGTPLQALPGELLEIGNIRHTRLRDMDHVTPDLEKLFKAALEPGLAPQEHLRAMGDLHWLLAHAMLDARGSAAKSEMLVRAVGYAVGIELPPFARGIVPDLEAFLTPREEFADHYGQLFTRPPLPEPLDDGLVNLAVQSMKNGL